MKKTIRQLLALFTYYSFLTTVYCTYSVHVSHNGPIVRGATITFNATVYYGNNIANNDNFKYEWEDNGIPQHTITKESTYGIDIWSVPYDLRYPQGRYEVQVTVIRCYTLNIFCYPIGSDRAYFTITETLNGEFKLEQKNVTRANHFVSSVEPVRHVIDLKKTDADFIQNATTILSYWFVDCVYYGITQNLTFDFNYTDPDNTHVVEALVVADFTPPPPTTTVLPTTTTKATTTTPKPTTTKPTTTSKPTTTATTKPTTKDPPTGKTMIVSTLKPDIATVNAMLSTNKHLVKRDVLPESITVTNSSSNNNTHAQKIMVKINGTLVPYNGSFPYVCNNTQVTIDPKKTYGYFSDLIEVKAPLSKPNVTGNNWLQPGDLLSLKVQCKGSKNMEYCIEFKRGEYNVTGNETCYVYSPLDTCDFSITRYLSYPKNTIIVIIKNEISKVVTPVTVNIYKVNKQAQLSVIVVPVAFSLVAVVLIVFGVAYYMQNRSRFIVEVADFNFSQQYSEYEYKTFMERLKDSVMNAFTRGPTPSSSEVPVWPPGQKYGSMT